MKITILQFICMGVQLIHFSAVPAEDPEVSSRERAPLVQASTHVYLYAHVWLFLKVIQECWCSVCLCY